MEGYPMFCPAHPDQKFRSAQQFGAHRRRCSGEYRPILRAGDALRAPGRKKERPS